jgi:hypothetical protein
MGPNVNVPSTWQHLIQPSSSNSQAMGSWASGYSSHHAHYGSECKRWAKLSYAIPAAQTISLEILAVHEGGVREKGSCGITIGVYVLSSELWIGY